MKRPQWLRRPEERSAPQPDGTDHSEPGPTAPQPTGLGMILNRFGVRGRLNLLLVLPLIAVVLVATPLVLGQIDDARSAGRTADTASQARQLGALVSELQRELLVTTAYVAQPASIPSAMLEQQRTVSDQVEQVRASLGSAASDELTAALTRIGSVDDLRRNAVARGVSIDSLARTYHAVTEALIDALRLIPKDAAGSGGADAASTQALVQLDALLRANEQSALRGTALITAAVSPAAGRNLLTDATAQAEILTQRFVEQAEAGHATLVVLVDQGEAGRLVDALARQVPAQGDQAATAAFVADALTNAEAQASQRRATQDRVTTEIADAAAAREDGAATVATAVGAGAVALIGLVALLSVIVSRSIANPLHRLTSSAREVANLASTELTRVADSEDAEQQVPRLAEIDVSSGGEVGELATAFNRVQSTAAQLLERQATNRRNVGLMFANVARRTQNLVQRQLAVVDELERNEQDPDLLDGLYRLDHLSTRLRRSADKLLVVAGSREQAMITGPIELATAVRSALAEIEDYKRVRLGTLPSITLYAPVASDLVLVFAELLENATAFSPPESTVDLSARIQNDGSCLVGIVDRGAGMTDEQLAEENRRLVERERLDIAPTGVLGLFVVGRLARRHSLNVGLVNTPGGGVTALLTIPPTLFSRPTPSPRSPAPPALPRVTIDGFGWFQSDTPGVALAFGPAPARIPMDAPSPARGLAHSSAPGSEHEPVAGSARQEPAGPQTTEPTAPVVLSAAPPAGTPKEPGREGLWRRVPGAQLPAAMSVPGRHSAPERSKQNALAMRSQMEDYQWAIAEAARRMDAGPTGNQPAGHEPPAAQLSAPAPPSHGAPPPRGTTASAPVVGNRERRGGLTRRMPGTHLAPGLRHQQPAEGVEVTGTGWEARDAEAERFAFDALAAGFAQADALADTAAPDDRGNEHGPDPTKESTR